MTEEITKKDLKQMNKSIKVIRTILDKFNSLKEKTKEQVQDVSNKVIDTILLLGENVFDITNDDNSPVTKDDLKAKKFSENELLLTELLNQLEKITTEKETD